MDILSKAGLPSGSFTVTMTASDGFSSPDFTAAQLQGTILGLKRNGVALDTNIDGDNPIQLVVPGDYGSSWIKVPTQITITPV
jgi:Oxidoreductase molybdopterin binding domain.